ncbi:hypothetical protein D9619_010250 [Psilocybe cf. subviscida]|uniref:Uncharacterized protein n=1 Tax=Psilocybe cf. subviscida TaxID=2480587 RepID=A0A8H5AST8_9AGAR|nr:hypothetical protein D9619_010250 [Psilocybe cf. subviscida]
MKTIRNFIFSVSTVNRSTVPRGSFQVCAAALARLPAELAVAVFSAGDADPCPAPEPEPVPDVPVPAPVPVPMTREMTVLVDTTVEGVAVRGPPLTEMDAGLGMMAKSAVYIVCGGSVVMKRRTLCHKGVAVLSQHTRRDLERKTDKAW